MKNNSVGRWQYEAKSSVGNLDINVQKKPLQTPKTNKQKKTAFTTDWCFVSYIKISLKWIIDIHIKPNIKFVEDNIGANLCDSCMKFIFLRYYNQKAWSIKTSILKNFYLKETMRRLKSYRLQRDICKVCIWQLWSKIYKDVSKLNNNETNNWKKQGQSIVATKIHGWQ